MGRILGGVTVYRLGGRVGLGEAGGGGVLGFWWLRVWGALGVGFGGLGFRGTKRVLDCVLSVERSKVNGFAP